MIHQSPVESLGRAYDAHATTYGRERNAKFDQFRSRALDRFVRNLPGPRVLDLGSGPGHEAVELASRGCTVTALDASLGMLNECRSKGFDVVQGDMRDVASLVQESFDGIWAAFSLLHLSKADARDLFAQLESVVSPRGVVAVLLFRGEGEGPREADIPKFGIARYFAYYQPQELAAAMAPSFSVFAHDSIELSPRPSIAVFGRRQRQKGPK